jgi:hypothetical protein
MAMTRSSKPIELKRIPEDFFCFLDSKEERDRNRVCECRLLKLQKVYINTAEK